jgi:uncharacterized protein YegP (UPF0339 family)
MISIHATKDKQFFVRITGKNNQVLMSGEPLKTKASCKKQILAMYRELVGNYAFTIIEVWDADLKKKVFA